MKKILITLILILCGIYTFAQSSRKFNNWVAHSSFTINKLSIDAEALGNKNSKGGFSVDVGAKQFFIKNCGWFMEESLEFFFSDLPHATNSYHYKNHKGGIWTWGCEKLQETGVGGVVLTGYDFRLSKNVSCEVFAGFNYRRILNYKEIKMNEKVSEKSHILIKNDQKWKFGIGVNYRKVNIRCCFMPTKRETRVIRNGWTAPPAPKWTTTQWTFGIGYHF